MQSDIAFLRTRKPPGPQGCLMEKPLNFLHPLGNFEGCSRHYAPVLERFVILVSDHTNRSQRVNDAKKSSGYLHKREETSRTSPLYQHTKRVAPESSTPLSNGYPGCEGLFMRSFRFRVMTKFVDREKWFITHVIREICCYPLMNDVTMIR